MASPQAAEDLAGFLRPYAEAVNPAIEKWLSDASVPAALTEAMRYASLDAGKRIRPALVMLSAEAVARPEAWAAEPTPAAVAIELVHCYSLVHDDLPPMDDDALRRGRPSTHVKFGQAMAILAGSALLTRAFEVLSLGLADASIATKLVAELAAAAGPAGMIAGQVADMGLCPVPDGAEGGKYIHVRKTGTMIRAATRMGGICAGADSKKLTALSGFGEKIGLAFQITDDLLDATQPTEMLGKTAGKDARDRKRSYAAELGIEPARRLAREVTDQALAALEHLGPRAAKLRDLAALLSRRNR